MAAPSIVNGDLHIRGNCRPDTLSPPDGCIDDDAVQAAAGIKASKLEHQHRVGYAQESATLAADESRVLHVVFGNTGSIQHFEAGSVVACTGTDKVEIDLLKDGVSVLTAKITLDSTSTAYIVVEGAINTAGLVDGDVLEVHIDATAGDGVLAKGVFVALTVHEDAE